MQISSNLADFVGIKTYHGFTSQKFPLDTQKYIPLAVKCRILETFKGLANLWLEYS